MTSKASKLRIHRAIRAGRPRKENVDRYPSGQIKHSETEKEVKAVAIEALKRVHGLDYSENGYSGFTLGRMYIDGNINKQQLEAGSDYAEQMARYYSAVGVPFPSARAQDLFSISGFGGETTAEQARRARAASNKMMELEGVLQRCEDGPRVKTTVFNVCVMDYEGMRTMPPQQLLWLKRGLNALIWHRGLEVSRKSD